MTQTYFVDAWYFIALLDPRDTYYRQAKRIEQRVQTGSLVTHESVLSEVLNYFSSEGVHARALAASLVRRALLALVVIKVDRPLFLAALERYENRADREFSHVDCLSMVIMEQRGIRHVLTNDHHFSQAGFVVVNQ